MIDDLVDIFAAIKSFFDGDRVKIDNIYFRILTKYSTVVFGVCFFVNVVCLYFTESINCISDKEVKNVIDSYCWMKAMHTLPEKENLKKGMIAHEGVRQYYPNDELIFHRFYQFVYMILFLQAATVYVPRYLWRVIEDNRIRSVADIAETLNPILPSYDEETAKINEEKISKFIQKRLHHNNLYIAKYFLCEFLAILNMTAQVFFVNLLVGGTFYDYGSKFLFPPPKDEYFPNPMARAFPKVTKCTFKSYGPSGNIVPYDALCVLPINIVNEKIYLVLWFWFAVVFFVSVLAVIYRLGLWSSHKLRIYMFSKKLHQKKLDFKKFQILAKKLQFADWFYLNLINDNTPKVAFTKIINALANEEIKAQEEETKCLLTYRHNTTSIEDEVVEMTDFKTK